VLVVASALACRANPYLVGSFATEFQRLRLRGPSGGRDGDAVLAKGSAEGGLSFSCRADGGAGPPFFLDEPVEDLVSRFRRHVLAEEAGGLDTLINNAGCVSAWYMTSEAGYEMQFAVNHLAPFLLTAELLPLLAQAPVGRVVTVSSNSHRRTEMHWPDVMYRRGYNTLWAYKQSKLANVLFTLELNRRLGQDAPVRAYAVDPGLVNTAIGEKGTPGLVQAFWKARRRGGTPPDLPAATIAFLMLNPSLHAADGLYWKNCSPKKPGRSALDKAAALRLWEYSKTLCGIGEE